MTATPDNLTDILLSRKHQDVKQLAPGLFSVMTKKDTGYVVGLYSVKEQKILLETTGFFCMLSPESADLVQVWEGRECGVYSLKKGELVLPITCDSVRLVGDKLLIDADWRPREIAVP